MLNKVRPETLLLQSEHQGGLVSPLELSSTFYREIDGSYPRGYSYTRRGSPLRHELEQKVAALEGGAGAFAFSSGMAAISSLFQALKAGDEVLIPNDCYYATRAYLTTVMSRWKVTCKQVDMTDLEALAGATSSRTRMVWVETPSNPLLKVSDLGGIAALCRNKRLISVCDNTVAGPLMQKPLEYGFDWVVHSLTKSLNGHSDVLGGIAIYAGSSPLVEEVRDIQVLGGAVLAPFDCWLTLRGLKTLVYRVEAQSKAALQIAKFLEGHSEVEKVHYPGLKSHPQYDIASKQMRNFGSLLSVQVKKGEAAAMKVVGATKVWARATSLGSVESLIEHRASMEDAKTLTPRNLIRLSVGLEAVEDLLSDLKAALDDI